MNLANGSSSTRKIHRQVEKARMCAAHDFPPQHTHTANESYSTANTIHFHGLLHCSNGYSVLAFVCTSLAILNCTDVAEIPFSTVRCIEVFGWCFFLLHSHFSSHFFAFYCEWRSCYFANSIEILLLWTFLLGLLDSFQICATQIHSRIVYITTEQFIWWDNQLFLKSLW